MSKQLSISAAFSVFAMAAFVLLATPDHQKTTGAQAIASAPVLDRVTAAIPLIGV